ncbi:hypothetical protein K439DRAFT_1018570 [Ramaria rubella]|nr:hypothetical protein K439DRAFT_1018570 [Ramaria rubella]
MSIFATTTNHWALCGFTSLSLIYNTSRRPSVSMRRLLSRIIAFSLITVLIAVTAVYFLQPIFERMSPEELSEYNALIYGYGQRYAQFSSYWFHERSWIFWALYSYLPGQLIAISLRFDYKRYKDASEIPVKFLLTRIPAPKPSECGKLKKVEVGEGIIIPSQAPMAFPKIYFTTALLAWSLVQYVTYYEGSIFWVVNWLISLPVMCFALLAVAAVRRELKVLWGYEEMWAIQPKASEIESLSIAMTLEFNTRSDLIAIPTEVKEVVDRLPAESKV